MGTGFGRPVQDPDDIDDQPVPFPFLTNKELQMAKCPQCGKKISFWTDRSSSICDACRERLKSEREEKTQELVDQINAQACYSRYSCPRCKSSDIIRIRRQSAITFTSSLSFALRRCRECEHEWLQPRNGFYLGFLLTAIIALMVVDAILLTWFVFAIVAEFNAQPANGHPNRWRSIVIESASAIAVGGGLISALSHCITAMGVRSRAID